MVPAQLQLCGGRANLSYSTVCQFIAFSPLLAPGEVSLFGLNSAFKLAIFQLNFSPACCDLIKSTFCNLMDCSILYYKEGGKKVTRKMSVVDFSCGHVSLPYGMLVKLTCSVLHYKILEKWLVKKPE